MRCAKTGVRSAPCFIAELDWKRPASVLVFWLICLPCWADISAGTKQVSLETNAGEIYELGKLEVEPDGRQWRFEFLAEQSNFSDQFLSMRPFKCIDGRPMYCHLVYPYDKPATMTEADFGNLEYEFLFIVRAPNEYGIDPYNGRYFVIREEHGRLLGEVRAVDLNLLAAPPDAGVSRPITESELDRIELESERFPRLVIR